MFKKFRYALMRGKIKQYIFSRQNSNIKGKVLSHDKLGVLEVKTDSFSTTLFKMIDAKQMTDVECYKRANVDRKLFSKIRSNDDYKPSKNTVFAFAIALKLDINETVTLLKSAGYSLSHSFVTDIIVEYFISKKKYDINLVNIALDDYKQPPLGSV